MNIIGQNQNTEEIVPRIIRQEYWIDVLGGILPGILVIVSYILIFAPTLFLCGDIINAVKGNSVNKSLFASLFELLKAIQQTPNILWLTIAFIVFFISYIIGHIFYRKDPQKPNRKSLKRLMEKEAKKEGINLEKYLSELKENKKKDEDKWSDTKFKDFNEKIRKEYACSSEDDCQFPFPYFDEYLENRGLGYLKDLVPWKGEARKNRTKNFINILKTRIRFFFPNQCGILIRNEAHVRLACSAWYAGRVISWGAVIALLILSFTCFGAYLANDDKFLNVFKQEFVSFFIVLLFVLSFVVIGETSRRHIEMFLHYQRQREIVHVLETAWTAFKINPDIKLKMNPPFDLKKEG